MIFSLDFILNIFKFMSLAFDEYGRPFIVLKEQDSKKRIKGIDAIKVSKITFREIYLQPNQLLQLSGHHLALKALINLSYLPTKKLQSPMTVLQLFRKWRFSIQLLDY